MKSYTFEPIGQIRSCFKEKFGIPRQPGLIKQVSAELEIFPEFRNQEAFRELEAFSHIWLVFVFHACQGRPWKTTVRPPRLGGNQRVGIFASRSGFRPNPIGQSVVALAGIENRKQSVVLHLRGADLLDGTPVLDIKPYLPYADSVPDACAGYAGLKPQPVLSIAFSNQALATCHLLESQHPGLKDLIHDLLALDPRPAYHRSDPQREAYGMRLWDWNVRFRVEGSQVIVEQIEY
jgi:tRNA-Thr(GGU) m(6)t(6)A37 methyltransferase TsaA